MAEFDALLIPRERPSDLLELKKALLTFDRVFLFEPTDREVIPPAAFMMAMSGGTMPIGLAVHPVLPLGKAPGFHRIWVGDAISHSCWMKNKASLYPAD